MWSGWKWFQDDSYLCMRFFLSFGCDKTVQFGYYRKRRQPVKIVNPFFFCSSFGREKEGKLTNFIIYPVELVFMTTSGGIQILRGLNGFGGRCLLYFGIDLFGENGGKYTFMNFLLKN